MSAKYFSTYVQPKGSKEREEILKFVDMVNDKRFDEIIDTYGEKTFLLVGNFPKRIENRELLIESLGHSLSFKFDVHEKDSLIKLEYDTFVSFDAELFCKFLMVLGSKRIESEYDHSGVSEVGYLLNDRHYDSYYDNDWKWLEEPDEDRVRPILLSTVFLLLALIIPPYLFFSFDLHRHGLLSILFALVCLFVWSRICRAALKFNRAGVIDTRGGKDDSKVS